ncbi:MAG: redoxin domain-containing protein [Pirellulales bacterium]
MRRCAWFYAVIASACLSSGVWAGEKPSRVGRTVEEFALRDCDGREHKLADYADKQFVVLAFLGVECPLAKFYAPQLNKLAEQYAQRGVAFLAVDANQQDSIAEMQAYVRQQGLTFPFLKDPGNRLADAVDARRTPEVFVLDRARRVVYAGRIDDQYGFQDRGVAYQLAEPRRQDLAAALDELLDGKPVSVAEVAAQGCLIGRARTPDADAAITFSNQMSRLFNQHCVECHRPGQIGPFPLLSYDDAAGWAEMIREVVNERRMPPWHADPAIGHFTNDARLSDEEIAMVNAWVAAGAPEGNPSDLPEPPQFAEGWMIPEPDQVIYMADEPYDVPATGTVPYQRFVVDPGWTEDKWITAIEPKAGNPAVVHHVVMYLMAPGGPKKGAAGRLRNDWLAAYAPGLRPQVLPEGYARYAPAGSKLIFELHYTPNGVAQSDRSYLGLVFADPKTVRKEVAVKNAGNFSFKIPPHDANFEVQSEFAFREDTLLWSVSPHMHVRGKDFLYEVIYPDGKREQVLWVPRYDFGWQTTYVFTEPMVLPKGSKLHCTAHFDNSVDNLNNPDPSQEVRWGEQTWEEMMFGWFEMALVDQDLTKPQPPRPSRAKQFLELAAAGGATLDEQTSQVASKGLDDDQEDNFKFFSYYLKDRVPQLDRVCISYVDGDHLRLLRVEELDGLRSTFRSTSTIVSADGQALANYLSADKPIVVPDLSKEPGSLAKRMHGRGLASSVHIPVQIDGRPATVNFWSTEADAFPPAAVELLAQVAAKLTAGR